MPLLPGKATTRAGRGVRVRKVNDRSGAKIRRATVSDGARSRIHHRHRHHIGHHAVRTAGHVAHDGLVARCLIELRGGTAYPSARCRRPSGGHNAGGGNGRSTRRRRIPSNRARRVGRKINVSRTAFAYCLVRRRRNGTGAHRQIVEGEINFTWSARHRNRAVNSRSPARHSQRSGNRRGAAGGYRRIIRNADSSRSGLKDDRARDRRVVLHGDGECIQAIAGGDVFARDAALVQRNDKTRSLLRRARGARGKVSRAKHDKTDNRVAQMMRASHSFFYGHTVMTNEAETWQPLASVTVTVEVFVAFAKSNVHAFDEFPALVVQ